MMGTCAKCGASVIDSESWKEAYISQLSQASKLNHELQGFLKLFAKCLYNNPAEHLTYRFDYVDAVRLDIVKYIPRAKNNKENQEGRI